MGGLEEYFWYQPKCTFRNADQASLAVWECVRKKSLSRAFTLLQLRLVALVPLHQSVGLRRAEGRVEDLVEPRVSLLVVDELGHLIDGQRPVIPSSAGSGRRLARHA